MDTVRALLRQLINDFHESVLPSVSTGLIRRDLSLGKPLEPAVGNLAKVVTGIRRCGKTFRLYQEVVDLRVAGISADRICFLNFDDDRLKPYPPDIVSLALEVFFELYPQARSEGAYLFFDEIQDVPHWEDAARRIVDTEKVTMYLTGSSSKLLSQDVATQFRGRSIAFELSPFSFAELARSEGLPTQGSSLDNKEHASALRHAFEAYLIGGGFPAARKLDDIERVQLLQTYVQLTVARDVVERSGYSNAAFVQNLARIVTASSARDFSINKVHVQSKARGYSPGRDSIAAMLVDFEDAHLAYGVYEFSRSVQKIRQGGFKMYSADPGLMSALSLATTDGLTRALETAVYLELRRRRKTGRMGEVSMLKLPSGKEVDFIWGDEAFGQAYALVQVCVDMSDSKTRMRELSSLDEALEMFPDVSAVVVTLHEEGVEHLEHGDVNIVPAWRWMLGA